MAANRARLASSIGLPDDRVVWMNQVHGDHVELVEGPRAPFAGAFDNTDALVTTTPRLALAVVTADCVPVLMADDRAGVIGAAHAGRVGAAKGIALRTLEAMVAAGARVRALTWHRGAFGGRWTPVPRRWPPRSKRRCPEVGRRLRAEP